MQAVCYGKLGKYENMMRKIHKVSEQNRNNICWNINSTAASNHLTEMYLNWSEQQNKVIQFKS